MQQLNTHGTYEMRQRLVSEQNFRFESVLIIPLSKLRVLQPHYTRIEFVLLILILSCETQTYSGSACLSPTSYS